MRCAGIDVSYANGKFQWQKFQDDFAMVKATQGRSDYGSYSDRCIVDSQFVRNVQGCLNYNVPFGVYHYLTATTVAEATEEAQYFVNAISKYKSNIKLWCAVDVESCQLSGLSNILLTDIVSRFCRVVRDSGYKPMVYTASSWICYGKFNMPVNVPLWLALWTTNENKAKKYNPVIWQYGVNNTYNADGNIGYFTLSDSEEEKVYSVGDTYTVQQGDTYTTGVKVPSRLWGKEYTIGKVKDGAIYLPSIWSWVKI